MNRVWLKGKKEEMNVSAVFAGKFDIKENSVLKVCAKHIYNVYIDGKFVGNGPSRCAHGRNKTDTFSLLAYAGRNIVITVEVESYNVDCFEAANDRPYFSAEISQRDGEVYYTTEDFSAHEATDRLQKVSRYSYQRTFSEYYLMDSDVRNIFRSGDFSVFPKAETEESGKTEIITERTVKYPTYKVVKGMKFEEGTLDYDEDSPIFTDRFISDTKTGNSRGYSPIDWTRDQVTFISKMIYMKDADGKYGRYSFYDFGAEYTGFTKMSLDVTSDKATVYFAFDEVLTEGGETTVAVPGLTKLNFNMAVYQKSHGKIVFPFRMRTVNIVAYELKKGHYELQSAEPYSMRYGALIVREGKIENEEVSLIRFENPDIDKLIFNCEDKDYMKIMDAAKATFAQNAVDIFMDCPSRERGGWLCDSYFTSMAEKLLTGDNIVERHFLDNYANCPYFDYFEDGVIPMVYPGDYSSERYIPNWMMWYINELETAIERNGEDYITNGDKLKVENLIKYFERYENSDGLLEKLPSWVFVEWSMANEYVQDVNYPSNMCYCGMLKAASKILGGRPELLAKAEKIRKFIRENARLGDLFIDNAEYNEDGKLVNTDHTTETCQYYAFYFGIATPEEDKSLFDFIVNELGAGRDDTKVHPNIPKSNAFIGNYLRLDFLAKNGFASSVAEQCKGYFLYMAERTGTLWENATTSASCNHGFASYAANILLMGLCGIRMIAGRKIYTVPTNFGVDCEVGFPTADGYVVVKVANGKREIVAPDGFEIIKNS